MSIIIIFLIFYIMNTLINFWIYQEMRNSRLISEKFYEMSIERTRLLEGKLCQK